MTHPLRHILFVDDNSDDNFIHQRVLKKAGVTATVSVVRDGRAALDLLEKAYGEEGQTIPPDLIFVDIRMPLLDGWGFLEQLQMLTEGLEVTPVVVMLSTSAFPQDSERANASPLITCYLEKPLSQTAALEIIAKHFGDGPDDHT